jgi:signal transduction histidine kinase
MALQSLDIIRRSATTGHPDEIATILRGLANGERVEQIEAVRRRKDGSLVDVSLKISPILDASGHVVGASTIARDITERKRAEEAREQTNAQLEGILGSIPEPVMVVDENGHLVESNHVFERRHLTTAPSTLEQYYPAVDVFTEDGHPVPPEMWPLSRAIRGERISGLTLRLTFGNAGPPRFYRYSANPIYDRNGRVTHAVAVFFDVTENRLAEAEIRRLNADLEDRVRQRTAQLEAANKELEAFAYSVSHDLRTPLRGIDGWSLALVEDYASQLDPRAHGYLDRVRAETQRMGMLIDDLLKLSRVTRSEMATGAVDLTSIAQTIATRLTEGNSGRRIEFTIAGSLAANGDARLLAIALDNLFNNAVKFTGPRGEARIEFGRTERDGERPFYVRDNGVGFDMAFAGMMFGAFQRMHKASEFPGTGIGLATVQRIIHRHGGRVWAEAQPDRGATFYFTLGGS